LAIYVPTYPRESPKYLAHSFQALIINFGSQRLFLLFSFFLPTIRDLRLKYIWQSSYGLEEKVKREKRKSPSDLEVDIFPILIGPYLQQKKEKVGDNVPDKKGRKI